MNTGKKYSLLAAAGLSLAGFGLGANAAMIEIHYDDIITGETPDSVGGGDATGGLDWMVATIEDTNSNEVTVTLDIYVDPSEFITHLFFDLIDDTVGSISLGYVGTDPALQSLTCTGADPAGTGGWDICLQFDPSDKADSSDTGLMFTLTGTNLDALDFASDDLIGWSSALHIQGIEPNCSAWVGDFTGGRKQPGTGGDCIGVPEPSTLSLLGLGLVSMLGAGVTNSRRRRRSGKA